MRNFKFGLLLLWSFIATPHANATAPFSKVFIVLFENTNASDSQQQPFMKSLLKKGAYLNNFHAEGHPSQPNYIAMTSGDPQGVGDDGKHDLDVRHIGDLLEAKGKTWKSYAESYPGDCFTGVNSRDRLYWRKHEPFVSYRNVNGDRARCNQHIVNADELQNDLKNATLPDYSFYVPDIKNDGHDTGVGRADQWLAKTFGSLLKDPKFMQNMLFVVTFDENDAWNDNDNNLIYTLLLGDSVISGSQSSQKLSHYSLLKLIEDTFGLGNLGLNDASAGAITGIWK